MSEHIERSCTFVCYRNINDNKKSKQVDMINNPDATLPAFIYITINNEITDM